MRSPWKRVPGETVHVSSGSQNLWEHFQDGRYIEAQHLAMGYPAKQVVPSVSR